MDLLCWTVIDFLLSFHYSSTNVVDDRISNNVRKYMSLIKLEKKFSCRRVINIIWLKDRYLHNRKRNIR